MAGGFLAIAMHLFISRETCAPALPGTKGAALPAAIASSQTCAEFFLLSYFFALTAVTPPSGQFGTKVNFMLGQAFYLHATTCQMANCTEPTRK